MQRDTASVTGTTLAAEGATGRSVQAFPPRLGPRPLAVALGLWIRWLRIPVRFSALFPLVIVLVAALFTAVGDPSSLPLVVGGVLIFAGVYVSGAVFGLNPLGEAADMRIVEFLSPTTPRTLVIGHVLAGLLVGSPVGVAGAAILAAAMDLSAPTAALAIGILTVVLTIASGGAAVGIGSVLTSTDAQQTYRGYEVATPSQWALVAYMVTAVLLVVAAMGAVLVLLSSDTGTGSSLFVAASGLAAVILLSVGYAGFRVAVGRFGALPYRDADDDGAVSQSPGADGSASNGHAAGPQFHTHPAGQRTRPPWSVRRHPGTLGPRLGPVLPRRLQHGPALPRVPRGTFLLLSIGLVYLGFTRWVGVDLLRWWFDRQQLRGDLRWGVAGIVLVLAATLGGTFFLTAAFPGIVPVGEAGAALPRL